MEVKGRDHRHGANTFFEKYMDLLNCDRSLNPICIGGWGGWVQCVLSLKEGKIHTVWGAAQFGGPEM